ncbi:MAG: hypothetical protein KGL39_37505 [Patescibacteria group bacterium]|nr:hypothetical protein [Patescibacteria group bacterium]
MPTYALTSGNFPVPVAPPAPTVGPGTSGNFGTGMTVGVSSLLNQLSAIMGGIGQYGGGGYGILSGCVLTNSSGLNVALGTGVVNLNGLVEFVASGAYGYQKNVPTPYTLADNSTNYVWLTGAGALIAGTTLSVPAGAVLFLATVTTSSGAVTAIDESGSTYWIGGLLLRITADAWAPTDSPPSGVRVYTRTASGVYFWDGLAHKLVPDLTKQLPIPYNHQALTGDLTLVANSPNVQALDAGASNRNVNLPDPTLCTPGHHFTIQNIGASNNLVVKNHSGTTLVTLTPGQSVTTSAYYSSGTLTWPGSLTAGTPGGPL